MWVNGMLVNTQYESKDLYHMIMSSSFRVSRQASTWPFLGLADGSIPYGSHCLGCASASMRIHSHHPGCLSMTWSICSCRIPSIWVVMVAGWLGHALGYRCTVGMQSAGLAA
jgi:hypothetical protein